MNLCMKISSSSKLSAFSCFIYYNMSTVSLSL